jgi:phosphoribosyl 1,2-cyclic phosphate phosphodiesterase
LNAVKEPFGIGGLTVIPIPVSHAGIPTYGYRLEDNSGAIAYIPDCQELDEQAFARLQGLDLMILDTLRHRPHPTHFTVAESVAALKKINAGQSYLTHICHELDHRAVNAELPPGIRLAYDGLKVEL